MPCSPAGLPGGVSRGQQGPEDMDTWPSLLFWEHGQGVQTEKDILGWRGPALH